MTFKRTYDILQGNELVIKLPPRFKHKKRVRVTVEDIDDSREHNIKKLQKALNDPLFLSDVNEITGDFEDSDQDSHVG